MGFPIYEQQLIVTEGKQAPFQDWVAPLAAGLLYLPFLFLIYIPIPELNYYEYSQLWLSPVIFCALGLVVYFFIRAF